MKESWVSAEISCPEIAVTLNSITNKCLKGRMQRKYFSVFLVFINAQRWEILGAYLSTHSAGVFNLDILLWSQVLSGQKFQPWFWLYLRTYPSLKSVFSLLSSVSTRYSREGLDGGITKYRVFEVHWNIPDFLARLNNLKSGVRCWETVSLPHTSCWLLTIKCLSKVMLGEQKVTLALEREARYWTVPYFPLFYGNA